MNAPHIAVYQYLAYNGGFAKERTLIWGYAAVGVDGTNRNLDGDGWHGHPDPVHAEKRAKVWSEFTGWPIVNEGRNPERDHTLRHSGSNE